MYNKILIIQAFQNTIKFSIVETKTNKENSYQTFYRHMNNIIDFTNNFLKVFGPVDKIICVGDDHIILIDKNNNAYDIDDEIPQQTLYTQQKLKESSKVISLCEHILNNYGEIWNNIHHVCYNYEYVTMLLTNHFSTQLFNVIENVKENVSDNERFHKIVTNISEKINSNIIKSNPFQKQIKLENIYELFLNSLWKQNKNVMVVFSYPKTKLYIRTDKFNMDNIHGLYNNCNNTFCTYQLYYNILFEKINTLPLNDINTWLSSHYLRNIHIWYKNDMFYSSKFIFVPFQKCYKQLLVAYIISQFEKINRVLHDIQIPISNIYITGNFTKYKSILQLIADITNRHCIIINFDQTLQTILTDNTIVNKNIIHPNTTSHKQIHMYINKFSPFLTTKQPHINPTLLSDYVYSL